ncbi:hypothetical protein JCGZ_10585 [Jatropha curcas]|uniref:Uncharacterized protein n=1 Tax=Jatropha curcas TaxID=180498 RepID=A0A067KRA4_JATCU|nr:hypothetical protein JCGZ_10585 [Jatropha curcas]
MPVRFEGEISPCKSERSRPTSSVAVRQWPIARSSTAPPPAPPPLTSAPPPFEIASPEQQERYNKLSLCSILPHRFIDENALAQVGLRDAVIEPLSRAREDSSEDEKAKAAGGTDMEEGNPPPFGSSFGADRFQSIEIMHGSLDSRIDTLQGQLQTVI